MSKKRMLPIFLVAGVCLLFTAWAVFANPDVTITEVSGGSSVSIDTTSDGGTSAWTDLTGPVITEGASGDISEGSHVITLPSGWEFNTAQDVNIGVGGGTSLSLASNLITPGTTTLSFYVDTESASGTGSLTFSNIQVRPTNQSVATGTLTYSGAGLEGYSAGDFGSLTTVAGAADEVRVETASDGSGSTVSSQNLTSRSTLTVYSVTRDQFGNFIANVAADAWTMESETGGVADGDLSEAGDDKSAVLTGELIGTGVIRATEGELTSVDSGTITVIPGSINAGTTTFTVSESTRTAGTSTVATITPKDTAGNNLGTGETVVVMLDGVTNDYDGSIVVTDVGNGTYTASVKVTNTSAANVISASGNGTTINQTRTIIVNPAALDNFLVTPSTLTPTTDDGFTVTLTARDEFNNTKTDYTGDHSVAWTWASGGSSSPAGSSATLAGDGNKNFTAGVASGIIGFKLVKTETATITATADSESGTTEAITANPGDLNDFTAVPSTTSPSTDDFFTVTLTARDTEQNTKTDYTGDHSVAWTFPTGGSASPRTIAAIKPANGNQTFVAGQIIVTNGFKLTKSGESTTITATADSESGTTAAITATVGALDSYNVVTENSGTETAGTAFTVTVTARDYNWNTKTDVSDETLNFTSTATNSPSGTAPAILASEAMTFVAGVDTTTGQFTLTNAGEAPTITATGATSTKSGTSSAIAVSPAVLNNFLVTPSTLTPTTDAGFTVVLTARDVYNNTQTTYDGSKSVAWTWAGTATGDSPAENSASKPGDGAQTFDSGITDSISGFQFVKTGTATITATADTKTGTSATITVNPGDLNDFTAVPSTTSPTTDAGFVVTLTARDAEENTKTDYTGNHSVAWAWTTGGTESPKGTDPLKPADGNQLFTSGTSAVSGFQLTLVGESTTITATADTKTGTTEAITATVGALDNYGVVTENSGTETAGTAFTLTVTARDAEWNTKTDASNETLSFTSNATASPKGNTPADPADESADFEGGTAGVHTTTVTFNFYNSAETPTITVTGDVSGTSETIDVKHKAVDAFTLTPSTSTPIVGTPINLVVTAIDEYGNTTTGANGETPFTGWVWFSTDGATDPSWSNDQTFFVTGDAGQKQLNGAVTFTNEESGVSITASNNTSSIIGTATGIDITDTSDTTSPLITVDDVAVTQTTATISFTSNEAGITKVGYGLSAVYGNMTGYIPMTADGENEIALTGLTCGTTYHYTVYGKDSSDNEDNTDDATFATSACTEPTEITVTATNLVKRTATKDGTQANGWHWLLDVTLPSSVSAIQMSFTDFTGAGTIDADNIHFYSAQSESNKTRGTAIAVTDSGLDQWSSQMAIDDTLDLSSNPGTQIQVRVEVGVPEGSADGYYSASYDIQEYSIPE